MKRKWIRYIVKTVALCIGIWMLLLLIAFFYIRANKAEMSDLIKSEINQKISGVISFNDLSVSFFENFPGISMDLENVHINNRSVSPAKKELLHVQHLYVGFGIVDLLRGKKLPKYLTLSGGTIHLFVDSSGVKNWDILKKQPGTENKLDLKRLKFKNINAIFEDNRKSKFYNIWFEEMKCAITTSRDFIEFHMANVGIIKNASFNINMGSYLVNKKLTSKWKFTYDKSAKKISMRDQSVKLNGQSYKLSGEFLFGDDPYFELQVETSNLQLKEAASLFPLKTEKRINQFEMSKPLANVRAFLSGPMKYLGFPVAKIYFSADDASVRVSSAQFQHCTFNGSFKNVVDTTKPPSDYNSVIQFSGLKGEWEENSFDGENIYFYNLIHPYLKSEIHLAFKLAQMRKIIASPKLDLNSGDGEAILQFEGPLIKADTSYKLSGSITINNGDITYNPRRLNFKRTDIELFFRDGDMLVKKMKTEINDNKINISGRVKDFLNFFNADSSKTNFEWNIYSPHLDIGKLTTSLHRSAFAKRKQAYSFFDRLNDKIDRLFDDCNAYLDLKADKLVYKNFLGTDVKGKLTLTNDVIKLDNFSLLHAGGSVMVSASSRDNGKNSDLVLLSKMQNVNIKELFSAFNNFGMESLTTKNIDGRFSADINLTSMLDANNDLYKPANKGYINFSLQNGKLENFRPLIDIDNNFLQKRDLSTVDFAELKDRFDITGNDIKINRMEIKSTAINMYIEGIYSFANNTDLSIQIPLHGQKKDGNMVPENKGNDSKGGVSVFLRARDDKDGKLKIGYDLLGRFRNKK